MKQQKPLQRLIVISIVSGIVSGIVTNALFWFVFPSAWFFFIIPGIMGWSIDHFGKFPKDVLQDEESLEKLMKQTGFMCAGMCLLIMAVAVLPLLLILPAEYIYANIIFYLVCGLCVYLGYNRGQRCIMDALYDSELKEEYE